jgi:hypothetical protein
MSSQSSRTTLPPNVLDRAELRRGHCFVLDPGVSPDAHRTLQAQLDDTRRSVDDLEHLLNEAVAASHGLQSAPIEHRTTLVTLDAQAAELQRELTNSQMINKLLTARAQLLNLPLVRAALLLHGKSKQAKGGR